MRSPGNDPRHRIMPAYPGGCKDDRPYQSEPIPVSSTRHPNIHNSSNLTPWGLFPLWGPLCSTTGLTQFQFGISNMTATMVAALAIPCSWHDGMSPVPSRSPVLMLPKQLSRLRILCAYFTICVCNLPPRLQLSTAQWSHMKPPYHKSSSHSDRCLMIIVRCTEPWYAGVKASSELCAERMHINSQSLLCILNIFSAFIRSQLPSTLLGPKFTQITLTSNNMKSSLIAGTFAGLANLYLFLSPL